jgi:hypothetical protein
MAGETAGGPEPELQPALASAPAPFPHTPDDRTDDSEQLSASLKHAPQPEPEPEAELTPVAALGTEGVPEPRALRVAQDDAPALRGSSGRKDLLDGAVPAFALSAAEQLARADTAWERRAVKVRPDWTVHVPPSSYALHRVYLAAGSTDLSSGSELFRLAFRAAGSGCENGDGAETHLHHLPHPCRGAAFTQVLHWLYDGAYVHAADTAVAVLLLCSSAYLGIDDCFEEVLRHIHT